jgi:hypothetical protein
MNKKFFLFGMIALLGASVFFLGCPTDSDGGDNTPEKSAAQKVGEAFGDGVEVDGTNVKLTADKTLSTAVTIPEGVTLNIAAFKLTTGGEGILVLEGNLAGQNGAKIVVGAFGKVRSKADVFFLVDGTGVTPEGDAVLADVPAGVYDWNADVDGEDTAGWKQQAQSGTVANVTVSGTIGTALAAPADVAVSIVNDTFVAIGADADLASWITNLPAGLTAVPSAAVTAGATSVTITVAGTPTVASDAALAITVPAGKLAGGDEIIVTQNPNAKFAIQPLVVTFECAGGSDVAPINVDDLSANTVTLPEDPTKENAFFSGWFTAANGGGTEFTGETEVTANITVHALWLAYSLKETCNTGGESDNAPTESGISISSARLNTATKTVTINLTGTFDADYVYTADGDTAYANPNSSWEDAAWTAGTTPQAGTYGAVNIKGLFPTEGWNNVAIKGLNPALVFYATAGLVTGTFESPVVAGAGNNIKLNVVDGEVPFKWAFYGTGNSDPFFAVDDVLGVLLYDSGDAEQNKIVRIEVTQYEGNAVSGDPDPVVTIIIDYSAVEFIAE